MRDKINYFLTAIISAFWVFYFAYCRSLIATILMIVVTILNIKWFIRELKR